MRSNRLSLLQAKEKLYQMNTEGKLLLFWSRLGQINRDFFFPLKFSSS